MFHFCGLICTINFNPVIAYPRPEGRGLNYTLEFSFAHEINLPEVSGQAWQFNKLDSHF